MITQEKKDELITRAVDHAAADRLIQNYGYFEPMEESEANHYNIPGNNGERSDWAKGDFAGCAIGCLATPVMSKEEYREQYERYRQGVSGWSPNMSYDEAVGTLEDEFGIPRQLIRMAEALFERLEKDDAMKWPEQFARALPVGVSHADYDLSSLNTPTSHWNGFGELYFVQPGEPEQIAAEARDHLLGHLEELVASVTA